MEDHRRYLETLRDACARRPQVHAHQIAALDRELSLAAGEDIAGYMAASGDVFEFTRAMWLDRVANEARVAAAVGDRRRASAAALEYEHALGATGHGDWGSRLAGGSALAAADRARAAECGTAFGTLLVSVIALQGATDEVEIAAARANAAGAHEVLRAADPGFSWPRVAGDPLYDLRTPWTGRARVTVGGWLAQLGLAGEATIDRTDAEPGDPLAAIDAGATRWRAGLAATREGAGAPEHLTPPADAPPLAEPATRLRAPAEHALARRSVWPDPLVEHHWTALLSALDETTTPTEVELLSVHAEACQVIEADWNAALLGTLLAPMRAACLFGAIRDSGRRAGVRRAAQASHDLVGLGPRALLDLPRVADFAARIVLPLASHDPGDLTAGMGEAGHDTVLAARRWFDAARDRGEEEPRDAGSLRGALIALLDAAGAPELPPRPLPLTLWGTLVEPADLLPALAAPRRPPIPGQDASGGARRGL